MTPLDFSGVFDASSAPEEPQRPTPEEVFIFEDAPTAAAATDTTEPLPVEAEPTGQTIALQQEQEERARLRELIGEYQDNKKKSELLRVQALKAIKEGEPLETVNLILLECVSRMTNNKTFLDACVNALKEREKREKAAAADATEAQQLFL